MLVLSRQRDEAVMIGDKISVSVVDIRGDKVRLGFEAPRAYPIHRREVYETIHGRPRTLAPETGEEVSANAAIRMAELRNRLCRENALIFCDGNHVVVAMEHVGNFGIEYQLTMYRSEEVAGKTVIVSETITGCSTRADAAADFVSFIAEMELQPNESTSVHLTNVLKLAARAVNEREVISQKSPADVPLAPAKTS